MGDNPRFYNAVLCIHKRTNELREKIGLAAYFVRPRQRGGPTSRATIEANLTCSTTREACIAAFTAHARSSLPFLLGTESRGPISGKLCIRAARVLLGVSLNFLYRRPSADGSFARNSVCRDDELALIDMSGARTRVRRRIGNRSDYSDIDELPNFECGCTTRCFASTPVPQLHNLFEKYASLSRGLKPQEKEKEFIILRSTQPQFHNCL